MRSSWPFCPTYSLLRRVESFDGISYNTKYKLGPIVHDSEVIGSSSLSNRSRCRHAWQSCRSGDNRSSSVSATGILSPVKHWPGPIQDKVSALG